MPQPGCLRKRLSQGKSPPPTIAIRKITPREENSSTNCIEICLGAASGLVSHRQTPDNLRSINNLNLDGERSHKQKRLRPNALISRTLSLSWRQRVSFNYLPGHIITTARCTILGPVARPTCWKAATNSRPSD